MSLHGLAFLRWEKSVQVAENTEQVFASVGQSRWNRKRLRKDDRVASADAVLEEAIFGREHAPL